jgi:hypothetical protein
VSLATAAVHRLEQGFSSGAIEPGEDIVGNGDDV